jgi:hypothetical protein
LGFKSPWLHCPSLLEPRSNQPTAPAAFQDWYRATFICHEHTGLNSHKPYLALRAFLAGGGTEKLQLSPTALRPDLQRFLPLLDDK